MPHRWVVNDTPVVPEPLPVQAPHDDDITTMPPDMPVALACSFDALPFPSDSIDLVVLPHIRWSSRTTRTRCCARSSACCVPEGRW
jgi:hypothetical protein